jgi:Cft2 family RNA processing exonuclease
VRCLTDGNASCGRISHLCSKAVYVRRHGVVRKEGLYCVPGQFYIDPWRPVERAVITHAHGDHARGGHQHYLAAAPA